MIKYINSFSIFFSGLGYWDMIPLLIRLHHLFYDNEWEMVIHHDRKDLSSLSYGNCLHKMNEEKLIRLVLVEDSPILCKSMLWRMKPIWESDAEYTFCRDADSLLTARQRLCVQEFISSEKSIHGINDNVSHNIQLMGGMIGCNNKSFVSKTNIKSLNDLYGLVNFNEEKWATRGSDQELLMSKVWPYFKEDSFIHDFNNQQEITIKNDFPKSIWENDKTFSNYIGACGINTKISKAIDFYNSFVPKNIIDKIIDIEKNSMDDIYKDNLYNL